MIADMTGGVRTLALAGAVAAAVMQAAISGAHAQGPDDDEADPVFVFNKVCYSQVPSIRAIRDMASRLAWQPLEKSDLKPFATDADPEVLEGWDVQVGKRFFRLGLVRSAVSDKFKQAFPAFADGSATSCTLVLDGGSVELPVDENVRVRSVGPDAVAPDLERPLLFVGSHVEQEARVP